MRSSGVAVERGSKRKEKQELKESSKVVHRVEASHNARSIVSRELARS